MMKRFIAFFVCIVMMATILTGCMKKYVLEDGRDYKNPSLSISYVSSEKVKVSFSAEIILDEDFEIIVNVVLVSDGCVIASTDLRLSGEGKGTFTVDETLTLTHHNYGAITGYVNSINGFYYDL